MKLDLSCRRVSWQQQVLEQHKSPFFPMEVPPVNASPTNPPVEPSPPDGCATKRTEVLTVSGLKYPVNRTREIIHVPYLFETYPPADSTSVDESSFVIEREREG